MQLFDVVRFYDDDSNISYGIIIATKQVPIKYGIPFSREEGFFITAKNAKTVYIIRGRDRDYERDSCLVKKVELKSLQEYTTQELIDELKYRKDIECMSSGKVLTIIQK